VRTKGVAVNTDGSGQADFDWTGATKRQQLDVFLAGPMADEMYTLPGSAFDDDPLGKLDDSDKAVVDRLLADIAREEKARGHPASELEIQAFEARESAGRIREAIDKNAMLYTYISDLITRRSEYGGRLDSDDLAQFDGTVQFVTEWTGRTG
jgi:hypothetical protein